MPNPEWIVDALEFRGRSVLRLWFEDDSGKDFNCAKLLAKQTHNT